MKNISGRFLCGEGVSFTVLVPNKCYYITQHVSDIYFVGLYLYNTAKS